METGGRCCINSSTFVFGTCLKKHFDTAQVSEERRLVQRPSPSPRKRHIYAPPAPCFEESHFMILSRPSNVRVAEGEIGM